MRTRDAGHALKTLRGLRGHVDTRSKGCREAQAGQAAGGAADAQAKANSTAAYAG